MIESDIKAFYQRPWVMVASDGGIGALHPRGAGTFPRVLGLYVREKHWLTLPEAIRKMTSLPAKRVGWKDRASSRSAFADLVLFNPDTVIDHSTFSSPFALSGHRKSVREWNSRWSSDSPQAHARARLSRCGLSLSQRALLLNALRIGYSYRRASTGSSLRLSSRATHRKINPTVTLTTTPQSPPQGTDPRHCSVRRMSSTSPLTNTSAICTGSRQGHRLKQELPGDIAAFRPNRFAYSDFRVRSVTLTA